MIADAIHLLSRWGKGLLPLLLAGVFSLSAAEISAVRFEQKGGSEIPPEMLSLTLRLRPGMEFQQKMLDEDIKKLFSTGKVSDAVARIYPQQDGRVEVVFIITPAPFINELRLEGNQKFSTKELQASMTLAEGERFSSKALQETLEKLRIFYREKGYTDVRIDLPVIQKTQDGKVNIIITIQENLRLKIHDVSFEGVKAFREGELRDQMANQYSYWNLVPFINDYLNRGLFHREELEADKARLRELYHTRGYLDFKVVDIVITPTEKDPEYVDLLIKVEEGDPYKVDKVTISGGESLDKEMLEKTLMLTPGETFSRLTESETIRRINLLYDARGYADAEVRAVRHENYPTHQVSVNFQIKEGRKYHVNEVILNGNTMTKSKVLLREMAIQPGDPVAKNRMEISRQRLLGMGYFSKVTVEAVNADDLDSKDVRVTVEEKPDRYNFRLGAGASDINKIFGMAEISTDNFDVFNPKNWFYGGGQRMRIQGIIGVDNAGFNVDFVEPWFLDLPIRFELSGYLNKSNYDDWDETRTGGRFSFQRKFFDDFTSATLGYKFEVVRVSSISSSLERYFEAEGWDGNSLVSQPSLSLTRDTRDSLVDPTEGYMINLFGSITPKFLGSSSDYYRLEAKGSYHCSFFDKAIVAMVGAKIGVVSCFNTSDDVPVFERYFLGGSGSLRGFDYRSVGDVVNDKNVGGQTMMLLTAEVTHPIFGPLRGAVFVDAGNAWKYSYDINFAGFNVGAGYGFRLQLPMLKAPLKLDLAYPVVKSQDDVSRKLRLHFNVGFTF